MKMEIKLVCFHSPLHVPVYGYTNYLSRSIEPENNIRNKLEGVHVDEHVILEIYLPTILELQVDFVMIELEPT